MKGLAGKKSYSERFVQVADTIKEGRIQGIKTDSDLCRAIGLMPQQLNKIRNGSQAVQVITLEILAEKFNVNPAFLLTGSLPMFLPADSESPEESTRRRLTEIVENDLPAMVGKPVSQLFYDKEAISYSAYRAYKKGDIKTPSRHLKGFLEKAYRVNRKYIEIGEGEKFLQTESKTVEEPISKEFTPAVITVDRDNEDVMVLIEQKVAASYFKGYSDVEWVANRPVISFPFMPKGRTTRAFQAEGDSMHPWFHNGCIVLCEWVENKKFIKQGYVHVIVSKEEGMTVKRLYTRGDKYRLVSDNPLFKPLDIPEDMVNEIWEIKYNITSQFAPPSDMEAKVNHLQVELLQFKSEVKDEIRETAELVKKIAKKSGI